MSSTIDNSNIIELNKKDVRTSLADIGRSQRSNSKSMDILLKLVDEHNQPRMSGILKFADRLQSMANLQSSRVEHALHTFGSSFSSTTRITAISIFKKRGQIHVQPDAVKRRNMKNSSKNKLNKGQIKHDPFSLVAGKRKRVHQLSMLVKENVPPSKNQNNKSKGVSMVNQTIKYFAQQTKKTI